jgi:L-2-hydroxyglutarate oxidase LhgO
MDSLDTVVIGAGVIGLAIARELAIAGHEVIVLEQNSGIGEETSSRNSEVIHAGIYYQKNSLKAQLCVRGKQLLYSYCEDKSIPHHRCGKVILALTEAQQEKLNIIRSRALINGVEDLEILSTVDISNLEPSVQCVSGLFSPSTGIIDSHNLMVALQSDLENAGSSLVFLSEFINGSLENKHFRIKVKSGETSTKVSARYLVNAGGLQASRIAKQIRGLNPKYIPEIQYAKGNYFVYQDKHPFQHLVYPVPEPGGLGIHVTLDLSGQVRFGPDVEWVNRLDYSVDANRADHFFNAIKSYWPEVSREALIPGYAGVRPKLVGPSDPPGDFMVQGPNDHGVPGLVNLFGIESPGLTASLAIAERVAKALF